MVRKSGSVICSASSEAAQEEARRIAEEVLQRGLEPESKRLWASHARPETFNQAKAAHKAIVS